MIKQQGLIRATFVIFGVVTGALTAELEFNKFAPHPGTWPSGFYEPDKYIGWKGIPNKEGKFIKGQVASYVKMNSQGFRDKEHNAQKKDDTFRILVLGDSFVAAVEVPPEKTFPYLLERELNLRNNKRLEVMNFGVPGFGTAQEYLTLKHYGLNYHPDFVILNFYLGNDVRNNSLILQTKQDGTTTDDRNMPFFLLKNGNLEELPFSIKPRDSIKQAEQAKRTRGHLRFLKDPLLDWFPNIYRYLNDYLREKLSSRPALGHFFWTLGIINTEITERDKNTARNELDISSDCFVYAEEYPPEWRNAWEVTKALLLRISKELDEKRIGFLVVIAPDEKELRPNAGEQEVCGKIKADLEKPERVLSKFLSESQIKYLQLVPEFRNYYALTGKTLHFPYGYEDHWNAEGHALAAKLIYRKLVDDKILLMKQSIGDLHAPD